MGIQKRYLLGIFWGILTSLGVMALFYMASDLARLPFLPVIFFRLTPGSIITQFVLIQAALICSIAGVAFSLTILKVTQSRPSRAITAGVIGAMILLFLTLLVMLFSGLSHLLNLASLFWLAILFAGWGLILARLIRELDQSIHTQNEDEAEKRSQRMSPRQFRYLVIAGSLTAIFSALRILWIRSGN